ncbi:MAG: homoserine dehydrogenase [Clostridia bacterium]|nr:homoserine dehydrogenase [Clostridia bacterium]
MKIAVMGFGTVGSGVVEIIDSKSELLASRCYKDELEVKYILEVRDFSSTPYASRIVSDIDTIVNDEEVGVVVETMGGVHPAFEFVMKCLNAGKSVVTSNKALVAEKAPELFEAARKNNAAFMFEAAVGGGIPIIRTMFSSLSSNEITEFAGILNGTTNFILTKMIKDNMSFKQALSLAQEKGYAEKDPTADIEGLDAGRKTCILASIAFGTHVKPEEIYTQGITNITLEDVAYVEDFGGKIKLLGRAKKQEDGKVYAIVSPAVVKNSSMLAGVDGVFNALLIRGDAVGEVLLYGPGAGKMATASAVVADVLDCVRLGGNEGLYCWGENDSQKISDYKKGEVSLYVRGFSNNKEDAVEKIRESFQGVTILSREGAPANEIAFVTGKEKEAELSEALSSIKDFAAATVIRVTDY